MSRQKQLSQTNRQTQRQYVNVFMDTFVMLKISPDLFLVTYCKINNGIHACIMRMEANLCQHIYPPTFKLILNRKEATILLTLSFVARVRIRFQDTEISISIFSCTNVFVHGTPWRAAIRLHEQGTGAFSRRLDIRYSHEDRPIPARLYSELCTWKAVLWIVIYVFKSHSGSPASPDLRPTPPGYVPNAYQPLPPSLPPSNPP